MVPLLVRPRLQIQASCEVRPGGDSLHPAHSFVPVLRKFTPDYRSADVFVALFATTKDARMAMRTVMGQSLGTRPHRATLVPLSILSAYEPLNGSVDEVEACLTITGFPASTTTDDLRAYFAEYQLRARLLGPSITWGTTQKVALVEFASRGEAHRAYRQLLGKPALCMASGRPYTPFLNLLL